MFFYFSQFLSFLAMPGQGFAGGDTSTTQYSGGAGGGGSGSAGVSVRTNYGGIGGAGTCSTITGQRVFYAGGGGSGAATGATPYGIVGLGSAGGGNGGIARNQAGTTNARRGDNATANTGSGGGGGGSGWASMPAGGVAGGNGASGIVIIRYPQINSAPALVTGSPQVSYSDGYQIYTFTSSGSIIF